MSFKNHIQALRRLNKSKWALILIAITICTGAVMSAIDTRPEVTLQNAEDVYRLLSADPKSLNDIKVLDEDLSNLVIKGITIRNLSLENVNLTQSRFEDVTFISGHIKATNFSNSTFKNVRFIDVELKTEHEDFQTKFNKSLFDNVVFDKSTLDSVSMKRLKKGSSLEFNETVIRDSMEFVSIIFESNLKKLTINKSDLDDIDFSYIEGNGDLVIANSTFNNSVMSWGLFKTITITDSVLNSSSLHAKNVDTVTIKRNKLLFTLGVEANSVTYSDNIFISEGEYGFSRISSNNIKKIQIINCNDLAKIGFVKSSIEDLLINNCTLEKLHITSTNIKNMNYSDSTISNFFVKRSAINHLTLNNIEFNGNITGEDTNISTITKNNVTIADDIKTDEDGKKILKQLQSRY